MEEASPINAKRTAWLGMLLAGVVVLSALEQALPPVPFLPPGVKIGLPNLVILYCAMMVGKPWAAALTVLKAAFVLFTRGPAAGALSLAGGLAALGAVLALLWPLGLRVSVMALSMAGAVAHNLGQLAAFVWIARPGPVVFYIPNLIVAGALMGCGTGLALGGVLRVLGKKAGGGESW
jgi:heptaprenyl diphosphate synthase